MPDKGLVLIGGGGHCKSVADSLSSIQDYTEVAITDLLMPAGSKIGKYTIVGTDSILPHLYNEGFFHAFITVGSIKGTAIRRAIYRHAKDIGFRFPSIIDKSAEVSSSAAIHQGVYVGKKAVINAESSIGDFAIINTGCVIEHECRIGDFTHVSVGATVCGGCEIERDVFIGANATIIHGVRIGKNSIIGAGSVVLADVPENTRAVGVWKGTEKAGTQ